MKKLLTIFLTLGLLMLLPLVVEASGWSVQVDNIYWERPDPGDQILWNSDAGSLLNANELHFTNASNIRLTLVNESLFNEQFGMEFSYYKTQSGAGDYRWFNQGELLLPNDMTIVVTGSCLSEYTSDLSDYELNCRYRLSNWITLLGGVRSMTLDERLAFKLGLSNLDTSTHNYMNGLQIGLDLHSPPESVFGAELVVKTGFYVRSDISNTLPSGLTGHTTNLTSGVIRETDADCSLRYRGGDHLQIRAGYYWSFFDGVALASEQLALTDTNMVKTGSINYSGAYFRIEFVF